MSLFLLLSAGLAPAVKMSNVNVLLWYNVDNHHSLAGDWPPVFGHT
jgi:hypothetical protein